MSESKKRIAEAGLRIIEEKRRDAELMQSGLPDPSTAEGPITFMGVTFYPDPANKCWRMFPENKAHGGDGE